MIPVWFKIAYTAFVLYVGVIWWKNYGWKNFLWFSDIAFIGAVPAMWLGSSALASVLAVAVLLPEILWNVDFAGRLVLRATLWFLRRRREKFLQGGRVRRRMP